jgi:hypothetical protein
MMILTMRSRQQMLNRFAIIGVLGVGITMSVAAHAVEVDAPAPAFVLSDVDGQAHALEQYRGSYVVLEWVNPDCPFVRKHYDSGNMQQLQSDYTSKGVEWLSINSSAKGNQGHYPAAELKQIMQSKQAHSVILQDPQGTVGRLYEAKTTPHLFIINPEGHLIYAGAIDDQASTDPNDIPKATNYVRQVLDAALAGQPVQPFTTRPYGCSVKYSN